MKRTVPSSSSITRAATAGSSEPAATPARSRSDIEGAPSAEAKREGLAGGVGKGAEPLAHELLERLRDRKRLERVDVGVEHACQLEREERVPARALVDAEQRLPREGSVEPVEQEAVQGADAERPDRQPPDALLLERLFELGRAWAFPEPPRQQHEHAVGLDPSQREREHGRRGRIEPLDIVDREHERPALAQELQHVAHSHGERAVVDDSARPVFEQERLRERPPPRRRQPGKDVCQRALEEVGQPQAGKTALGLGGPRGEEQVPAFPRVLDTGSPQRRLADPRLALQHECRYPLGPRVQEGVNPLELLLSPDDPRCHLSLAAIVTEARRGTTPRRAARPRARFPGPERRRGESRLRSRPRGPACS